MCEVDRLIAELRANPRDDDSGIPWGTRGDLLLDSDRDPLGWCESPEDAAHIAAAVNAAPVLLAEVDRLREELADERQAAMTIAAACLDTGVVPQGAVGTVDAVRAVCASAVELRAQLAAAREAVEAWPVPVHTLFCVGWKDPGFDFAGCDCGVDAANATRTAARRALGLEAPNG